MASISVLMPVYNGMPYIREAVDSVLAQDSSEWELIISDNGSTDGTRDYLDTLHDSRIRTYKQDSNLGIFGNLNFLLEQAKAPIAKILCADDKLLPRALSDSYNFMVAHPDCAICGCWEVGEATTNGSNGYGGNPGDIPVFLKPSAAILMFATFGNVVGNLSKAICRPRLVLQAGGFDQRYPYAGDYEGWVRVARLHGVAFLRKELVYVRRHSAQNSHLLNKNNELIAQQNRILAYLWSQAGESNKDLLRKHWTLHFIAPRTSLFFKLLIKGKLQSALESWKSLPANISALHAIIQYPIWKITGRTSSYCRWSTDRLRARINELQHESST